MDKAFFESLPEDDQTAIRESADEAGKYCTDSIIAATEAKKQIFIDAGCEIIETDISEWQKALDGFLEAKYPDLVPYAEMIAQADPAK
ncbi:hypothetical protein SDC9_187616 [bioreactor metagenome]|uniref:Solute-binding protein n=1 Tax=bioreactor metagenome TaxID=1076179 RepID=A0A645HM19_9ZZZZ